MAGYQTGTANRLTNDRTFTYVYDEEGNLTQKGKGTGQEVRPGGTAFALPLPVIGRPRALKRCAMRILCLLFLAAFAGAVVVFAVQNQQEASLAFLCWEQTLPVAAVAGGAYLLGMLSGWTIVGLLRRSFNRASEVIDDRRYAGSAR
jgi:uncharacterized integral membrane protein